MCFGFCFHLFMAGRHTSFSTSHGVDQHPVVASSKSLQLEMFTNLFVEAHAPHLGTLGSQSVPHQAGRSDQVLAAQVATSDLSQKNFNQKT